MRQTDAWLARARRARRLRREHPGGPVRRRHELRREGGDSRARSRGPPTSAARSTSTSSTSTSGSSAERIAHASEDTLDFIPPWLRERLHYLSDEHAARITLSGPHAPSALEGLDPASRGPRPAALPARTPARSSTSARPTGRSFPRPTPSWAEAVYPELDGRRGTREAVGSRRPHLPARRRRPERLPGPSASRAKTTPAGSPSVASTRSGSTAPEPTSPSACSRRRRGTRPTSRRWTTCSTSRTSRPRRCSRPRIRRASTATSAPRCRSSSTGSSSPGSASSSRAAAR